MAKEYIWNVYYKNKLVQKVVGRNAAIKYCIDNYHPFVSNLFYNEEDTDIRLMIDRPLTKEEWAKYRKGA